MLKFIMTRSAIIAFACSLSFVAHAYAIDPMPIAVPPGDLTVALETLAKQAHVEVVYQTEQLKGMHTNGVSGNLSPQEAIATLLEGTSLTVRTDSSGAMLIAGPLPTAPAPATQSAIDAKPATQQPKEKPIADANSKVGLWDRFRLAQIGQGTPSNLPSTGAQNDSYRNQPEATLGLQEIVVTAQKRVEDVDKVPISIAVFDRAQLDRQGVRSLVDIVATTPGIDFDQEGALNHISIRGISSNAGAGTVGIYIDDVPIQSRFLAQNLTGSAFPKVFDLDRVEILRGPQGTYFGAGAESGALRFITPQPSLTESSGYTREGFSGVQNGGIGYEAGLAIGGPVVDGEIGYRASYSHQRVAGYVDAYSTVPGGTHQANSNWSDTDEAKLAFLFQPNEHIKITPQIFFQNVYSHSLSAFTQALSDPSTSTYVEGDLLGTPDKNTLALPQLKMEFEMGGVTLTSISAYLYREQSGQYDYSSLILNALGFPTETNPADFTSVPYNNLQRNATQEIRLQNSDPNAKLKWVAGAFYSLQRQEVDEYLVEPNLNNYLLEHTGKNVLQYFGCCAPNGLVGTPGVSAQGLDDNHDRQLAFFGQIDYEILPRLTVTLGARRAKESNDFSLFGYGPLNGPPSIVAGRERDNVTTPKYGISYQINDKNLIYASASKGNRLGGSNNTFNAAVPGCAAELASLGLSSHPTGYGPDYVWNYEIGSKNLLFNDRLQIEMSIYHMKWSALQQLINVNHCLSQLTANIGAAKSDGFDLQITAQATESLKLIEAVGYSNARADETVGIPGGITFVNKGDQLNSAHSPWTLASSAEYDFKIYQTQPAYVRLDDEYRSRNPGPFTFNNPDAPASYFPNYPVNAAQNLLNLRLGTIVHGWDVALYAANLANSHTLVSVVPPQVLTPQGKTYVLTPRTIGITGNLRW